MPAPLPFFDTKSMLGRFGAARFCGILYGTICPVRRKRARPCARATCSGSLRGGVAEWLKAAVLKTVKPQGFVGSNPTASARNAARPEPAGSGRFSLFGPAFRLELPAHERMFHVKHSRGGRFARMEPASAAHDWAAHAQQNRRFGRPSPSPSIEGNTRPGVLPTSLAPSVLKPR